MPNDGLNFNLNTQQKDIYDLAIKFAKNEMATKASQYDQSAHFPKQILEHAWELGLMNTCIPIEYGGAGFSTIDATIITECLAYGCLGMNTSIMSNDLALLPIVLGASDGQKKEFLTPFTESYKIASFCLTEPGHGSDAAGLKTLAKEASGEWIISGEKMWITNAGHADLFVVYATVDPKLKHKGIVAIVVEKGRAGIELGAPEKKMGHRCSDTRAVRFNNVKVPKSNLIAGPGEGWKLAMKTLDHSRPLIASSAVGGAQSAMDHSVKYAKERIQFDVALSKHQAIQFMIANMAMKTEAARLLTRKAAMLLDQGLPNTLEASMAKAFAADACMEVATDAVQVFGGYGYSAEYPVEKIMRDAKLIQIYEGTSQIQRMVVAREILSK